MSFSTSALIFSILVKIYLGMLLFLAPFILLGVHDIFAVVLFIYLTVLETFQPLSLQIFIRLCSVFSSSLGLICMCGPLGIDFLLSDMVYSPVLYNIVFQFV